MIVLDSVVKSKRKVVSPNTFKEHKYKISKNKVVNLINEDFDSSLSDNESDNESDNKSDNESDNQYDNGI